MELSDSLNNDTNDDNIINQTFNCPVCLSDKSEEEKCITECGHEFCKNCIHSWLNRSKITCPSCRAEIKVYTNQLEKNHIIKVIQTNNSNNEQMNLIVLQLRNRIQYYHLLLLINFIYMLYSLYDGIKINNRLFYYESEYNNCTRVLNNLQETYSPLSKILVYFNQNYVSCEFPSYFVNKCFSFLP
tara:strand:- start:641 stop:1198 length:558 start_codon:yes stop_codon:yes gene_type:complete